MKAESNSLIYIIISIVLLIISSLGKNKAKKQAPQNEPEEDNIPHSPWPKDLEEVFGKMIVKEPESTQPESGREHWLDKEEEEIPEPVIAKAQQPYTPIVSTPDYSSVLVPLAVTQENEPEYIFKFDEDDMRKAVIYSEILNRKYI